MKKIRASVVIINLLRGNIIQAQFVGQGGPNDTNFEIQDESQQGQINSNQNNSQNNNINNQNTNTTNSNTQTTSNASAAGIDCGPGGEDLISGQCKFNIYETLGIKKSSSDTTPIVYVQDIILSATFFIGTVITAAIVLAGLFRIRGGISGNDTLQGKAKTGMINAIIGLVIVMSSYMIIRLVQFIVRGG